MGLSSFESIYAAVDAVAMIMIIVRALEIEALEEELKRS